MTTEQTGSAKSRQETLMTTEQTGSARSRQENTRQQNRLVQLELDRRH